MPAIVCNFVWVSGFNWWTFELPEPSCKGSFFSPNSSCKPLFSQNPSEWFLTPIIRFDHFSQNFSTTHHFLSRETLSWYPFASFQKNIFTFRQTFKMRVYMNTSMRKNLGRGKSDIQKIFEKFFKKIQKINLERKS